MNRDSQFINLRNRSSTNPSFAHKILTNRVKGCVNLAPMARNDHTGLPNKACSGLRVICQSLREVCKGRGGTLPHSRVHFRSVLRHCCRFSTGISAASVGLSEKRSRSGIIAVRIHGRKAGSSTCHADKNKLRASPPLLSHRTTA